MSYTFSVQEKQEYLRVEVTGERKQDQGLEDAKEFWLHMANLCNNKGVFRILTIFNLTGKTSEIVGYELGKWLAGNETLRKVKTAVVDLNKESLQTNFFIKTVATNRSRKDISRVFDNEQEAIEWLLE